MFKLIKIILLITSTLLLIFFNISCEKKVFEPAEYEAYIRSDESPYLNTVIKNGVKISLRYMPAEALLLSHYKYYTQELNSISGDSTISQTVKLNRIEEQKKRLINYEKAFKTSLHFLLTIVFEDNQRDIEYQNGGNFEQYSNWLQTLLFRFEEFIYIQSDAFGELHPSLCHMERIYGGFKHRNILVQFPKYLDGNNLLDKMPIEVCLKEFGLGSGPVTFKFDNLDDQSIKPKNPIF